MDGRGSVAPDASDAVGRSRAAGLAAASLALALGLATGPSRAAGAGARCAARPIAGAGRARPEQFCERQLTRCRQDAGRHSALAELIEQLVQRNKASKRAAEQSVTELAAPLSRRINVSFAPGSAVSIIDTVKGYPTAVSFFDSTGQPWPIQWDTNSNPVAIAGGPNCNAPTNQGAPSAIAIGFFVCTPTKGQQRARDHAAVARAARWARGQPGGRAQAADLPAGLRRRPLRRRSVRPRRRSRPARASRNHDAAWRARYRRAVPDRHAAGHSAGRCRPAQRRRRLARGPARLAPWPNVYLRTSYTLLSPEWTASEAEAGTTVYAVPNTPIVLLSVNGRTVSASLKDPP